MSFAVDEDMAAGGRLAEGKRASLALQTVEFKPQSFGKRHHLIEFRVRQF
jgi:hypothetical protein